MFRIINDGYDSLLLKCKLDNNIDGLNFDFHWIDDKRMDVMIKNVRVMIKFKWDRALSFSKKLIFEGKDGKMFPIMVSGTTDNSIFTLQSFLMRSERSDRYDYSTKEGPIMLVDPLYRDGRV